MLLMIFLLFSLVNISETVNYKLTSIYYGNQGWSMNQVEYLSSWLGKRPTVIVLFTDWCINSMNNLFNIQLNNIWNNRSIPLITWELFGCNGNSQPGIIKLVNNNTYDTYIQQFAQQLNIWLSGNDATIGTNDDRRAFIRLGHEMNGNWYPWSLNSTPNEYILSWKHIHQIFSNKSLDSTKLQWIWCVNNVDVGQYKAEDYWVGENYVDWLGIDGYNFGSSQSWSTWLWPNQIFDSMIQRLRNLSSTKPISINEYATTSLRIGNISDLISKIDWLNQFCIYMDNQQIQMASAFNQDKETDWAIFNSLYGNVIYNNFTGYSSYKDCLQSSSWITPDLNNQRIINDQQFAGRMIDTTTTYSTSSTTTSTIISTNSTISSSNATVGFSNPTNQYQLNKGLSSKLTKKSSIFLYLCLLKQIFYE